MVAPRYTQLRIWRPLACAENKQQETTKKSRRQAEVRKGGKQKQTVKEAGGSTSGTGYISNSRTGAERTVTSQCGLH